MSTFGLYSGLYADIRGFAELLDEVLIRLKSKSGGAHDTNVERLGNLLASLPQGTAADSPPFITRFLLEATRTEWTPLGTRLLSGQETREDLQRLEELARRLEVERAETFGKLRGR